MNASRLISFAFIYLSLIPSKNLVFSSDIDAEENQPYTSVLLDGEPVSEDVAETDLSETVAADPETHVAPDEHLTNEAAGEHLAEAAEDPLPENHVKFSGELVEIGDLKFVQLDLSKFENTEHIIHTYDPTSKLHFFSCKGAHGFGLVKESFNLFELEYLPKSRMYNSLFHLKSNGALVFHSSNLVDGAYFWDDSLVLVEQLRSAEAAEKEPESIFVTVEVDRMEETKYVDYAFDNDEDVHVFAAKKPFLIDSVKLDGEFIWVYDDIRNTGLFPFSVEFNGSDKIEMGFESFFITYSKNDQGKWKGKPYLYANKDILEDVEDEAAQLAPVTLETIPEEPEEEEPEEEEHVEAEQEADAGEMGEDQVAEQQEADEEPAKEGEEVVELNENEEVVSEEAPEAEEAVPEAEQQMAEPEAMVAAEEPMAAPEAEQQMAEAETMDAPEADVVDEAMAAAEADVVDDTMAVPVAEPVPAAEPVEPLLLDDHLVTALEFVWKQNVAALDANPAKCVFADYVTVNSNPNGKTVTIFFTNRTMRRFHRVGRCGPWREWVPPAKRPIMAA